LFKDAVQDFRSALDELPSPPPPDEDECEHKAADAPVAKRRKSVAAAGRHHATARWSGLAEEDEEAEGQACAGEEEKASRGRTKSIGGKTHSSARERPDVRHSVSDGLDVHLANALAFTPKKDFSKPSARG
jgi:hypothetical protein